MSTELEAPVSEAPCNADARRLLAQHNETYSRIVVVQPDCILYLDGDKKPRTAWMSRRLPSYGTSVVSEPGFVAERSVSFPGEDSAGPDADTRPFDADSD